jgi:hypothetical protein
LGARRYGIDDWAKAWHAAAGETIEIMAKGGDPNQADVVSRRPGKEHETLFPFLRAVTKRLCEIASRRDERFQPEKLWKFAKLVHRWCCGYRTPADFVEARSALDIATTELNRLGQTAHNRGNAPSSSNEDRDQFIFEEYQRKTAVKKIREQVNRNKGWVHLGSETAVLNAMKRYCVRQEIDISKRKQPRNKPK